MFSFFRVTVFLSVPAASAKGEPEAKGVRGETEESTGGKGEGGARKTGEAAKEEEVAGSKHRYRRGCFVHHLFLCL